MSDLGSSCGLTRDYLACVAFLEIRVRQSLLQHIMTKIKLIEHFRVPPRWLFVKVTDEDGNYGWGESTLEGHTQAVEGCLDALIQRVAGFEAEWVAVIDMHF